MGPIEPQLFGSYIREYRKKRGLTLSKLAELSEVSQPYLSQIENGKAGIPSPDILKKLHKHLNVKYAQLMDWAGYLSDDEVFELSAKEDEEKKQQWEEFVKKNPPKAYKFYGNDTDLLHAIYKEMSHYKGNPLSDKDRKFIVEMLDRMFPESKSGIVAPDSVTVTEINVDDFFSDEVTKPHGGLLKSDKRSDD